MSFLGAITAGASIASGVSNLISGHKSRKQQNSQYREQMDFAKQQWADQLDMNKNSVQYRVRDALKAGINPLAALGASSNLSPVYSGAGAGGSYDNIGDSIGQIAGGLGKLFTKQQKESNELSLESQRLDNEYKRAQIDHLRNLNPGITGGSYTRGVKTDRNSGPAVSVPAEDWIEGEYPGSQVVRTAGGHMFAPSSDTADSLDIEFGIIPNPYALEYAIRDYGGRFQNWLRRRVSRFRNRSKKFVDYYTR